VIEDSDQPSMSWFKLLTNTPVFDGLSYAAGTAGTTVALSRAEALCCRPADCQTTMRRSNARASEACASSPYWSRELQGLGHTVRLMAPAYVKPYAASVTQGHQVLRP
jgi:hypothetical protein